jgi:hypothetical protein
MHDVLVPTADPDWVLGHEGYSVLTESAVESRFALSNGFLAMRAARSVSRGPTWVSWLGYIKWPRGRAAMSPACSTGPIRAAGAGLGAGRRLVACRIVLNGKSQMLSDGEIRTGVRRLDMRRGVLLVDMTVRAHNGMTIAGQELCLVSQADCAVGLQLLRFSLDRDGVDVRLEATFPMSGLGMEPERLEPDLASWRAESTDKGVAMTSSATLRVGGEALHRAPILAALGLGLAVRRWPGGRTRPSRRRRAGGYPEGRSGAGRRRGAGAQPGAGLARGAHRA